MIPVLFITIPLIGGLLSYLLKSSGSAKNFSLLVSILILILALYGLSLDKDSSALKFNAEWLPALGSSFAVSLDGMSRILTLLTAISFPLIFISTYHKDYPHAKNFYALMLLSQAGLMGVFVATDALLFYFFWELALIPVYFLSSIWGGEKRIQATFKFFVYTFLGSLLMLIGILYLYYHTPDRSFALESFYKLRNTIGPKEQSWLFWPFFIAFAIKMPIFPFPIPMNSRPLP